MSEQATSFSQIPDRRISSLPWLIVARIVRHMLEIRRTRRLLAELDPRLLKDIGVSRSEAQQEIARAPWDFTPRRD